MTRIGIIGGGIGGLVAGLALRQAGYKPVIYERAAAFGEVGAGISLSPNAVKGLESLGMAPFLADRANEPFEQLLYHGETGDLLLRIDRRTCRATYGAAYYQMHRADLLAELVRLFGIDNCRFSKQLVHAEEVSGEVTLHFTDGTRAEVNAAIGADGLRSAMRDILFDTPDPVFSGHVAWRALIPSDRLSSEAVARSNINHIGAGRNLVTYPVRGTDLVNMVALTRSPDWAEESWSAKAGKTNWQNALPAGRTTLRVQSQPFRRANFTDGACSFARLLPNGRAAIWFCWVMLPIRCYPIWGKARRVRSKTVSCWADASHRKPICFLRCNCIMHLGSSGRRFSKRNPIRAATVCKCSTLMPCAITRRRMKMRLAYSHTIPLQCR